MSGARKKLRWPVLVSWHRRLNGAPGPLGREDGDGERKKSGEGKRF
jgi:hypothetical protein